uniref:Mas-related G-protein coupled receptor member X2 n=1 Tax=Colobus angolensis palliatus TaxID=336983 RepID=A0A2K5K1D5_COLAP
MDPTISAWGTELAPIHETEETHTQRCGLEVLVLAVLIFITELVGLAGNAVLLWLLGFHMQCNTFSLYIRNLARADFLFFFFQILEIMEFYNNFFHPIFILFPYVPQHYHHPCLCYRHEHTPVMCALFWALSLMLSILKGMFRSFLMSFHDYHCCPMLNFITVAGVIFLCVVLCGSSLTLLVRILYGSRQMSLTRLYMTILLTVLVFLLCSLPFGIQWFLLYWIQKDFHDLPCLVLLVSDPCQSIIYFFMGSFRQHQNWQNLKLVLQRALQDTLELPEETLELSGSRLGQ